MVNGVLEDKSEAVKWYLWYLKAAEQGEVLAQTNLARMYDRGEGVREDQTEAVKWYRKAAELGDSSAQYNLGVMIGTGAGAQRDIVEGYAWVSIAAAAGDADAKQLLTDAARTMTKELIAQGEARST